MSYTPLPTIATTVTDLRSWANREMQRISLALLSTGSQITLPVLNAAPEKPQVGQIVFADGANWNPGSGRGLYYYDSSWVFIA
jgi:hypothetical protein